VDETRDEKASAADEHQRSWWDIVAGVSGLVALLGALAYGLGLLALWVPIWRTYTGDWQTAWFAVSLVPNTVVAGMGVLRIVAMPTFYFLIFVGGYIGFILLQDYLSQRYGRTIGLLAVLVPAEAAMLGGFGWSVVQYSWAKDWNLQTLIAALVGMAVILNLIFFVLPMIWYRRKSRRQRDSQRSNDTQDATQRRNDTQDAKNWWVWLLVAFLLNYVIAAVSVFLAEPPLPAVDIRGEEAAEGALLAHTDGFWYVFDQEHELIAIPDDDIESVRVHGNAR